MRHDVLELHYLGAANVQTAKVKRGTLEVAPGHLSYELFEEPEGGRLYVPLHRLESWRYYDHSHTTP